MARSASTAGQRQRQVHRARLLRVGERDGREVRVRLGLLGDHDGAAKPARSNAATCSTDGRRRRAAACRRRQVARPVAGTSSATRRGRRHDVLVEHLAGRPPRHVGQRADRAIRRRDLGVGRRHDLAPSPR
jgi:hypothetical protein